jgi:hypothetical protein
VMMSPGGKGASISREVQSWLLSFVKLNMPPPEPSAMKVKSSPTHVNLHAGSPAESWPPLIYDAGIVWLRIGLQPKGAGHNQERQGQHTETHHPSTSWLDAEVNAAKYNPMWQTSPKEAKATGNPNRSTYIAAVSYVVGATGFEPVTSTV